MGRIILPNEAEGIEALEGIFPGPTNLNAPVTRGELAKALDRLIGEMADLSLRVKVHRVRFEAFLKMATHSPETAFKDADGKVEFQINAFYVYVTEYAAEFSPFINALVSGRVSITERVDAALGWNKEHPTMPVTSEELKLQELVEAMRRRLTDTEEAAPLMLPHSAIFEGGWQAVVAKNREIHPE